MALLYLWNTERIELTASVYVLLKSVTKLWWNFMDQDYAL